MIFYTLKLTQFDGYVYNDPFHLTTSKTQIDASLNQYAKDCYARVEIVEVELTMEEVIQFLIKTDRKVKSRILDRMP